MRAKSASRWVVLAFFMLLGIAAPAFAQIGISVSFGPPPLPVYEQPICPGEGYIWTPGYWAYGDDDYYWVPGTWVEAPQVGYLWTPGYWGWGGNAFFFHEGYWGQQVGFYGGISYGYGYFGRGYEGGRWDHDHFYYNRAVNNVNITEIHNTYNTTIVNRNETRVSYNGGNGGINERATSQEEAAMHERHVPPVAAQNQHVEAARSNRELRASVNQGKPPIAATARAADFHGNGAVPASAAGGTYTGARAGENNANRPGASQPNVQPNNGNRPPNDNNNYSHAKDIPQHDRPPAPNTGNPKTDQKYQQQQEKLYAKQQQDHQKLQAQQDQQHAHLAQQQANDARNKQIEEQHQKQTQQMEQKHTQQQQQMQQHQQPQHQSQPPPQQQSHPEPHKP